MTLGRTFDLVQSLEVAEHIDPSYAELFIDNLVRHSNGLICFSAAPPGQGGAFHVNEQPYDYWRAMFEQRSYSAYDFVRPGLADNKAVSFWYRFNTMLYVRADLGDSLDEAVRVMRIPDEQPIPDVSPAVFRARKQLVKRIPRALQDGLARLKARTVTSGRF
jgi:hypothetical protein